MSKLIELSEADTAFKESMVKLNSIKSNLEILDREIYLLTSEKNKLEGIIDNLKQVGIIALAAEYKKVRNELKAVSAKIVSLNVDKNNHMVLYKQAEDHMKKVRENLDNIQKSTKNKVIKFNFRK